MAEHVRNPHFPVPEFFGYGASQYCEPSDYQEHPLVASFDMEPGSYIDWRDPVWGNEVIKYEGYDRIWFKLLPNDAVVRQRGVNQLSLSKMLETVPDNSTFSRLEHLMGSVIHVRRQVEFLRARGREVSERESIVLQLRTFVSDLAHLLWSHQADFEYERLMRIGAYKVGGNVKHEGLHDYELMPLLEATGILDILEEFGIDPAEVVFPDIPPFEPGMPPGDAIECEAPLICTDRIDYLERQMQRMLGVTDTTPNGDRQNLRYYIDDKMRLVAIDREVALDAIKKNVICSLASWQHPVHRLQLFFQREMGKRMFALGLPLFANGGEPTDTFLPRDYMLATDPDVEETIRAHTGRVRFGFPQHPTDPLLDWLYTTGARVGFHEQNDFTERVFPQLAAFMRDDNATKLPDFAYAETGDRFNIFEDGPLEWRGLHIEFIGIKESPYEVEDFGTNQHYVDVYLPSFKRRHITPPYYDETTDDIKLLDENDPTVAAIFAEHDTKIAQQYVARIRVDPAQKPMLNELLDWTNDEWIRIQERPRMQPDDMRRYIGAAARHTSRLNFLGKRWRRQ